MTRFCKLCTQFRFCLVGFAVFCFSFAPVCANADLTQQQMQAAFYNALLQFSAYSSGEEGLIVTLPYDGDLSWALSDYLETHSAFPGIASGSKVGDVLGQISYYVREILASQGASSNDINRVVALLGSVSNQLDKTEVGSYANTVDSWLEDVVAGLYDETHGTPLLNKIRNFTYTQGSELRVHDQEAISYLFNLQNLLLSVIGYLQAGGEGSSSNVTAITDAIASQTEGIIDYLDQDPDPTISDAESEGEDDYSNAEDDADSAVEDFTPYEPETDDPPDFTFRDPNDTTGLSAIQDVEHSALIKLSNLHQYAVAPGNVVKVPALEIDLSTTPGVTSFLNGVEVLARAGYLAIFTLGGFILYFRAYRHARGMLNASRCSMAGCSPVAQAEPLNLDFNPL